VRAPDTDFEPVHIRIGRELKLSPDKLCVVMNGLLALRYYARLTPRTLRKIRAMHTDFERASRYLSKLRAKYADLPAGAFLFDGLLNILANGKVKGLPDSHVKTVKRDCARMAYFAIKQQTPRKTLGGLFETVTSLFYEYVTGEIGADCERACKDIRDEMAPKQNDVSSG
jgi:hypothetical protein